MRSKIFLFVKIFSCATAGVAVGLYFLFNLPVGNPSFLEVIVSIILGFIIGGLTYSFLEINHQERIKRKKAVLTALTKKE